jgi:hypothetical protein
MSYQPAHGRAPYGGWSDQRGGESGKTAGFSSAGEGAEARGKELVVPAADRLTPLAPAAAASGGNP